MNKFVSASQLAKRYSVHKSTIWRWVNLGILPKPIRFSEQCTRFPLEEIERRDAERIGEFPQTIQSSARKLDLSKCAGFDPKLEAKRDNYFQDFREANNPEDQREAMRGAASLTALREPSFVSDYERLLGIQDE
jgi:predicted DNA-binding transcriptional regulator AlpA